MADCPFCAIAEGITDAVIVWEDPDIVAFLDSHPVRQGHCQIIPRQHIEHFEEMSLDLSSKVLSLGQRLARRIKTVYGVDRAAFLFTGGDVPHVHAHVIPVYEKTDVTSARYILDPDGLEFGSAHLAVDRAALENVGQELRLD